MIRSMRNIGVRLWVTALVAVPAWVYFMPWLDRIFSGISPALLFFFLGVFTYLVLGFLMHLAGAGMIHTLIREAEVWERMAILNKAEKKYLQAVRIYDSFLLSPVRSAKIQSLITGSLARFSLTFGRKKEVFRQAALVHLAADPGDDALAGLWLKQFSGQRSVTAQEQDLLTRLAGIHCDNPRLAPLLTRIFLDLGRMDFSARQLFAREMAAPEPTESHRQKTASPAGEPDQTLGRYVLAPAEDGLQSPQVSFEPPTYRIEGGPVPAHSASAGIKELGRQAGRLFDRAWETAGLVSDRVTAAVKIQKHWRFYLKTGILGLAALGLGVFIFQTVSHLRPPKPVAETPAVVEKSVFKPFTIQVAAYLKEAHADQYVKDLKQQGIDARIKQTVGGGKTWYLIQVFEFEDKAAAAAYGNDLKSRNLIEDFFVSNK